MYKLTAFEYRKIWQNKAFLFPFLVLILLNIAMLPFNLGSNTMSYTGFAYKQIQNDLKPLAMPDKGLFLEEHLRQVTALYRIDNVLRAEASEETYLASDRARFQEDFDTYYDLYISGNYLRYCDSLEQEYSFLRQISAEYDTVVAYDMYLDSIVQQSLQLNDISIFNAENNLFHLQNAQRTAKVYRNLEHVVVDFFPQRSIMTILNYSVTDFLFVFTIFFLCSALSRSEKDSGLIFLLRSTKSGRANTAIAKMLAMILCQLLLVFLFYGSNFFYSNLIYGLGNLQAPIQSFAMLQRCPLNVTVVEYLLLFILFKWLASVVLGLWVMCAMYIARHTISSYVLAASLPLISLLMKILVPFSSNVSFLKYSNIVAALFVNEYLGDYYNLNVLGTPINIVNILLVTSLFFIILFFCFYLFMFQRLEIKSARGVCSSLLSRRKIAYSGSVIQQEAYKLFVANGAIVICIVFIIFNTFLSVQKNYSVDSEEIYYRKYMGELQGKWNQDKYDWLAEEYKKFTPILNLNQAVQNRVISPREYTELMRTYPSLQIEYSVVSKILSQLNSMKDIPNTQLVYDTGYYKLFGLHTSENLYDALLCGLLCAFAFSGVFAIEKSTGMEKMISSTPLGRIHTVNCKILLCFCVSIGMTMVNLVFRYASVIEVYGIACLSAPLNSLPAYAGSYGIPLFFVLILQAVLRFFAVFAMGMATLLLSYKCGNQLLAGVISATVFSLPLLLHATKAHNAIWFSHYPLFNAIPLLEQPIGLLMITLYCLLFLTATYMSCYYLKELFGQPPLVR